LAIVATSGSYNDLSNKPTIPTIWRGTQAQYDAITTPDNNTIYNNFSIMTSTEIANASKIMLGSTEAVKMYIGSTVIWEPQTTPAGPLPAGYTELEYISSTTSGGEYIDLNIKLYETANTEYDIAIKFNIKGAGSDNTS
jgi:hypothetical protein